MPSGGLGEGLAASHHMEQGEAPLPRGLAPGYALGHSHFAQKGPRMKRTWLLAAAAAAGLALPAGARAACCYFSAKNTDILQPAQKVFISWNPEEKIETFTVQPKFEGNALDFGMVIPTPSQPKLHEMPRDFFKHLAVYSILKNRQFPHSKLMPTLYGRGGRNLDRLAESAKMAKDDKGADPRKPAIVVLEAG